MLDRKQFVGAKTKIAEGKSGVAVAVDFHAGTIAVMPGLRRVGPNRRRLEAADSLERLGENGSLDL